MIGPADFQLLAGWPGTGQRPFRESRVVTDPVAVLTVVGIGEAGRPVGTASTHFDLAGSGCADDQQGTAGMEDRRHLLVGERAWKLFVLCHIALCLNNSADSSPQATIVCPQALPSGLIAQWPLDTPSARLHMPEPPPLPNDLHESTRRIRHSGGTHDLWPMRLAIIASGAGTGVFAGIPSLRPHMTACESVSGC